LGSLGPERYATAQAINDSGQITGHSGGDVFLYSGETGMVSIGQGAGFAINSSGAVAGQAARVAALFENGTTRLLGTLGSSSWANDVNDHKVIVGGVLLKEGHPRQSSAFLWSEEEGMVDLQSLIEPGWDLVQAWGINNSGQIIGEANGVAVRLDPIAPKLAIQTSTVNLVISWAPDWPAAVLESTESLTASDWRPVPTGNSNVVALLPETSPRFFRLNLESLRGLCCPE
jgi:uncharacterized membrane protein